MPNLEGANVEHVIIWADIPVTDLPRAMKFYGQVTGEDVVQFPGVDGVAVIGGPGEGEGPPMISADLYVGGTPSRDGPTVYLNPHGDIDAMLARVVDAGGQIDRPKAFMGPIVGWIATFIDSEGNRIGLQQPGDGTESA
jgi:predicted enzyme related to lactoylglutathione lyase